MRGRLGRWLVVAAIAALAAPAAPEAKLRVRKDVMALGAAERARLVDALLELKRVPSPHDPRISWYDQFVAWHVALSRCDPLDPLADHQQMGHGGPVFLPWHRQYLLMLEDALREVSGRRITIPYWDWTNRAAVDRVFADDFMGGDGDPAQGHAVTTGPFRKGEWELTIKNEGILWGRTATSEIVRNLGALDGLPTQAQVDEAMRAEHYDAAPWDDTADPALSFRNALEGYRFALPVSPTGCMPDGWLGTIPAGETVLHNLIHVWVGGFEPMRGGDDGVIFAGTMSANLASPNDPVFFLHHANVDRIWALWQRRHRDYGYLPRTGYEHNNATDPMAPFDRDGIRVTPADVENVRTLGYRYAKPRRGPGARAAAVCRLRR